MTKTITRKTNRLNGYDYSNCGWYFITICTDNRKCLFGDIIDRQINLNDSGKMIDDQWNNIPNRYNNVTLDQYTIMPNHMHGIIQIVGAGSPCPNNDINNNAINNGRGNHAPTLGQMIAYFKYQSTKQINLFNNLPGRKIWQRSFHDHIIRTDTSLQNIREYIINNPATWDDDENNINNYSTRMGDVAK